MTSRTRGSNEFFEGSLDPGLKASEKRSPACFSDSFKPGLNVSLNPRFKRFENFSAACQENPKQRPSNVL